MKRVVPLLTTLACCIAGAQVRFEAPKLGYVFDSEAKSIRQIGGVPGAAAFDATMDAGGSVERAWVGGQSYAIVQGKLDAGSRWVDFSRGGSVTLPDFQLAAVSSGGRYFAIATVDGAVEIREGATGALVTRVAAGVPAAVTALAVSDDGGAALIASATALSLWTSDRDGAMRNVWSGDGIRSVTFLGDTRDYAALDGAKYLVSRGGSLTENQVPVAGASAIVSIEAGAKLAVGGDRMIAIVDPGAGDGTVRVAVDGVVEGFAKVNGGGDVLQILLRGDGRTALLETSGQAQIEIVVAGGGIR
jgi:hypothetical protein